MDDRSRTVFHTINNRYRRPVVNPELSSRGAGRRWKIEEQEEAARCYRETRKQLEEPFVPSSTCRGFSSIPITDRLSRRKASGRTRSQSIHSEDPRLFSFSKTLWKKMGGRWLLCHPANKRSLVPRDYRSVLRRGGG